MHYRLAWFALVPGALAACVVLWAAGMRVMPAPLLAFAAVLAALFAAHGVYRHWRVEERLALTTGALGVMIAAAFFAGITANAGLRLRFPLFDADLAAFDRALGFDTPGIVLWTAGAPVWGRLLAAAYSSIFPLCFLSAIWLGMRRDAARLWELVLGFVVSIEIAAIVNIFVPAIGNIAHSGLGRLAGDGLPEGAGVYFLHAFAAYRDGNDPVLDLWALEGVVTFPSFHLVMALAVAWAFRGRIVSVAIAGWCLLVVLSIVPIGGHYVVDLLSGLALWLAVITGARAPAWMARRTARGSARGPKARPLRAPLPTPSPELRADRACARPSLP